MTPRPAEAKVFPASSSHKLKPLAFIAIVEISLTACGAGNTDEILRGGVPASINLPRATDLPVAAVRTVSRHDYGWRLFYHVSSAPPNADRRAAQALCSLESKRLSYITPVTMKAPSDDPGTRAIDIYCI